MLVSAEELQHAVAETWGNQHDQADDPRKVDADRGHEHQSPPDAARSSQAGVYGRALRSMSHFDRSSGNSDGETSRSVRSADRPRCFFEPLVVYEQTIRSAWPALAPAST
jgi:hypothetical protein